MYYRTPLRVASLGQLSASFGNIGNPHDPAATRPILVFVATSSNERCR